MKLALLCVSTLFALYAAELVLVLLFDSRTKFQATQDLRAQGVEAYPFASPALFIPTDGLGGIFPLSGIANKRVVYCNESGRFSIWPGDEHGFNNPRWEDKPEIVLIGDSFTEGACVDPGENIGSQLRHNGKSTMTLGRGGAGPLIELAVLREYATHLKPKVLLWFYYEGNDLPELKDEQSSAMLRRYLTDDNFSQNLIERQPEIDKNLTQYIDEFSRAERKSEREKEGDRPRAKLVATIKLSALRSRLALLTAKARTPADMEIAPGQDFTAILRKADDRVKGWGGQMYFIYLPSYGRYVRRVDENSFCHREQVLDLVRGLNIPVIDVHQMFAAQPDPLSLFPNRSYGHYSAEGYRRVAEYINSKL